MANVHQETLYIFTSKEGKPKHAGGWLKIAFLYSHAQPMLDLINKNGDFVRR